MKVYINGEGHMTKMAVMAINSKKPLFLFYVLVYNFFFVLLAPYVCFHIFS